MLGMNMLRRREKREKKHLWRKSIHQNAVLHEMEKDIIRNPMTRLEKIFGYRMKAHRQPKRDGLSHAPDNFYFLVTLNDQSIF